MRRRRQLVCWLLLATAVAACHSDGAKAPGTRTLITFTVCRDSAQGAQTLTIAATNGAFVDEASRLLTAGQTRIPVLDLLDGTDADPQWTWHADPSTPAFADVAAEVCDGCPRDVESDKPYWLRTVKRYCPWSATVTAVTRGP